MSDSEDGDISFIDYARYHRLCEDFTAPYPLSLQTLQVLPNFNSLDLEVSNLRDLTVLTGIPLDEKWVIDQQSASFLRNVLCMEAGSQLEKVSKCVGPAEFKVEAPLLPTDPDLDQRRFVRTRSSHCIDASQDLTCTSHWLEDERLHLHWPSADLPAELTKQIDEPLVEEDSISRRKMTQEERDAARQSSPLLPLSSPFRPSCPESPVSRMPLATSPTDPVPAELLRIEDTMDFDDDFSFDNLSELSIFGDKKTNESYSSPPLKRKRPEDYKIEVPMSPALQSSSPLKRPKTVTFSDTLCTVSPVYDWPLSSEDSNDLETEYKRFLEQVVEPAAQSAIQKVEHEELTEADSTMRAQVPEIDQTGPAPPWETFSRKQLCCQTEIEAQQQLISMLKREVIRPREIWPSVARVDKVMTRWRPFSMRLSDLPIEEIPFESMESFKGELPGDTTSGWKLDGLRALDLQEDDNEDIDFADMEAALPEANLTRDVSARGETENEDAKSFIVHKPQIMFPMLSTAAAQMPSEKIRLKDEMNKPMSILGGSFSASTSLDRFMQVHTGKSVIPKIAEQAKTPTRNSAKGNVDLDQFNLSTKKGEVSNKIIEYTRMYRPVLPASMPHRVFVISSSMFERRNLLREIKRLNPLGEYIERDFTSSRPSRGTTVPTSEGDEADMILAPGCGVVLTHLQKIKQRSLPGQVNRNLVRERILQTCRRYERLIVMVSEDRKNVLGATEDQQNPLDSRDCDELASLTNFCGAQSHDIRVLYIPGDDTALAAWIIYSLIRFGLDDQEIRLVQEETFWESFLRKAGMDAFAAQAVLFKLKKPDPVLPSLGEGDYGLPAFVMMSQAERLRRFSTLFKGERILRKVSMAIDGNWTPAVAAGDSKR